MGRQTIVRHCQLSACLMFKNIVICFVLFYIIGLPLCQHISFATFLFILKRIFFVYGQRAIITRKSNYVCNTANLMFTKCREQKTGGFCSQNYKKPDINVMCFIIVTSVKCLAKFIITKYQYIDIYKFYDDIISIYKSIILSLKTYFLCDMNCYKNETQKISVISLSYF